MRKLSVNINNIVLNDFNLSKNRTDNIRRIIAAELKQLIKLNGLQGIPAVSPDSSGKLTVSKFEDAPNDFQLARGIATGIYMKLNEPDK